MRAQFDEPWAAALLEYLSDGEWHDYSTTMDKIGPFVPDDLAFEKAEYYRIYHYLRNGKPVKSRQIGSTSATLRTGQRIVIARTIRSLVVHKRVVVQSERQASRQRPVRIRLVVDLDALDE